MDNEQKNSVIVGVGGICLSTENGDTHTLLAGGQECILSTMELGCLCSALDAYLTAMSE